MAACGARSSLSYKVPSGRGPSNSQHAARRPNGRRTGKSTSSRAILDYTARFRPDTRRIAEAVADTEVDIVVNVQGDEPFVKKELLAGLLSVFDNDRTHEINVASLMYPVVNEEIINNPNHVKVVVDNNDNALYFSRSVIPFHRDRNISAVYFKHIGIYAFRKNALMDFTQWPVAPLESIEKLEQLRYLENGVKIRMVLTNENPVSIDTPDDLEFARKLL